MLENKEREVQAVQQYNYFDELSSFDEMSSEQITETAKSYDRKQSLAAYKLKNRNIFADGYDETHGGTDYMKIPFLRRKGTGKKKESEKKYIDNVEKAKSRKGLLDGNEEGIFDNISDRQHINNMKALANNCKEYYDLPNATPDFLKTIAVVDKYITANTYEDQQQAVSKVLKAFNDYLDKHGDYGDDATEKELVENITNLKASIESRIKGSLVIPNDASLEDIEYAVNPPMGFFSIKKYVSVKDQVLFPHEPSVNDIKQRMATDCYMMSSLASIAYSSPELIKQSMKDNGDTVTVRFYNPNDEYKPRYITVKKEIPEVKLINAQYYATDSLWVQMIEKAYAVLLAIEGNQPSASYDSLNLSTSFQFLSRFLGKDYSGSPCDIISKKEEYDVYKDSEDKVKNEKGEDVAPPRLYEPMSGKYSPLAERAFENFSDRLRQNEIITVAADTTLDFKKTRGIHTDHAYGVLKVYKKDGMRYIRLRDPYGAYSTGYTDKGKNYSSGNLAFMFDATDTMGTFDMEWNDFLHTFNQYSGCKLKSIGELRPAKYIEEKAAAKAKKDRDFQEWMKAHQQTSAKKTETSESGEDNKLHNEDEMVTKPVEEKRSLADEMADFEDGFEILDLGADKKLHKDGDK